MMQRVFTVSRLGVVAMAAGGLAAPAAAQQARPDLTGMWSDPPATLLDTFCLFWCSDAGLERLNALLDDPANDGRPTMELYADAGRYQREEYVRPRLTAEGLAALGVDPADDPGFLYCEPWAFAREIFAPHQLEITQLDDRVELRYGEWEIRRTIYLDARPRSTAEPSSPMGHSVARYEGDALVIDTSGISANLAPWGPGFVPHPFDGKHSERLRVVERYTRSEEGDRLLLSATMEDPWALREPLVLKKVWRWAPDQEIFPYEDCERPTEFTRGTNQQ
jgi:hypothetical protein